MVNKPKLLITQFTHGSGGKFLSSVLQTSTSVDHWNNIIEQYKKHNIFHSLNVSYVRRSFPTNPAEHVQKEPMCPYNTDLFSSTYDRGSDVASKELLDHAVAVNDRFFINAYSREKYINLIMHRSSLPAFCSDAKIVIVTTETAQEIKWLHSTLWNKHFLEDRDKIYYIPDHPMYCNFKSLPKILEYKNPFVFPAADKQKIIQEKIVNNHNAEFYKCSKNFVKNDNNYYIPLSSFFDFENFSQHIEQIFKQFDFSGLDLKLLKSMHSLWVNCQIPYDNVQI